MRQVRRRQFLVAASGVVFASLTAIDVRLALAQVAAPRVAFLFTGSMRVQPDRVRAFRQRLRELGYVEGRNLILDVRELEGRFERLPKLMDEIVQTNPKVIVVAGSQSVRAAMAATASIAIVAYSVGDPVGQGFAASLARPGRNLTGNALIQDVSDQKTVEILHEIVPGATRVASLADPRNPIYDRNGKRFQAAAEKRGLSAVFVHASSSEEIPKAFADAAAQRANMLVVANDAVLIANSKAIVELAAHHRIPTIYGHDAFVAEGGLVTYAYSSSAMVRNAAVFVDRILKGQKPAELPFEQPTKFELVVNLKTAKALGIKIPQFTLLRADRVIE